MNGCATFRSHCCRLAVVLFHTTCDRFCFVLRIPRTGIFRRKVRHGATSSSSLTYSNLLFLFFVLPVYRDTLSRLYGGVSKQNIVRGDNIGLCLVESVDCKLVSNCCSCCSRRFQSINSPSFVEDSDLSSWLCVWVVLVLHTYC